MRDIEFRCWYDNVMYRVESIDFMRKRINLYAADIIDFKDGILMQFTGSYDKNGKEIYEGDIVKFNGKKYVIKYFNKYSRFALSSNDDANRLPMLVTNLSNVEVIGNVYENKESTVTELCGYCSTEVELPAKLGVYVCPNCRKLIINCSLCTRKNCKRCKYDKERI